MFVVGVGGCCGAVKVSAWHSLTCKISDGRHTAGLRMRESGLRREAGGDSSRAVSLTRDTDQEGAVEFSHPVTPRHSLQQRGRTTVPVVTLRVIVIIRIQWALAS